jgi:hypothetical protein
MTDTDAKKSGATGVGQRHKKVTTNGDPAQPKIDADELALATYPIGDPSEDPATRIARMERHGFMPDLLADRRCIALFSAIQQRVESGKRTDLTHVHDITDVDAMTVAEAATRLFDHQLPGRIADLRERREKARLVDRLSGAVLAAQSGELDRARQLADEAGEDDSADTRARSLVEFARLDIPDNETLLGNRYLCRGGSMLFVGPSGVGKSSSGAQQDICWGAGLPAFGIAPARPLKILCFQAENDDGDQQEMARGVITGLRLNAEQLRLVDQNTRYLTAFETGDAFIARVRREVRQHKPDLIRLDPLNAFLGDDAKDPKAIARFCRSGLNAILHKYRCGAIVCHHTPKTNFRGDTSGWSSLDWAYAGSGGADLTNWARAVLVLDPVNLDEGLFRLIGAKRGKRIGWQDFATDRFIAYAREPGAIYWRDADEDEVVTARLANPKAERIPQDLLQYIPDAPGTIGKASLVEAARAGLGIGKHRAESLVKCLLEQGAIHEHKIKRSGRRDGVEVGRHKPQKGAQ